MLMTSLACLAGSSMPKNRWFRGYLLGYALYLPYRLATATWLELPAEHWHLFIIWEALKAALWPIFLPFDLAGIRAPIGYLRVRWNEYFQ
jgi:hypothetical protein